MEIVQFNRCVAAKHAYQNFDFSFDWINGVNSSIKAFKWSVGDVDDFADLQVNFVLGFFGGVIAAIVLRSIYGAMAAKIYSTLAFFPLIPEYPFLNYISLVILLSGMFIGALGSTISLKRFLKV